MFKDNIEDINLAFSKCVEQDARITGLASMQQAEKLHRMAMDPDAAMRAEKGLPKRR